jgi:hypothetical protein
MRLKSLITIVILVTLGHGCSASDSTKKTDETNIDGRKLIPQLETNRQVTSQYNMNFPISDNPGTLKQLHRAIMVGHLKLIISDYRRVTGSYPVSLTDYIRSGFPLFWHRNLINGLPMEIFVNKDLTNDQSDYGAVKWVKYDDNHAGLFSSNIDLRNYKANGTISWTTNVDSLEFVNLEDYQSMSIEEFEEFLREKSSSVLESTTTIVGGTIPINKVSDPEVRKLYAQCGQLSNFIFANTLNYYSQNRKLPQSFIDHLTFQQKSGPTPFIIKENFNTFKQSLTNANVELKVGYDYSNSLSYTLLKINGETLISHCYKYDYDASINPTTQDETPGMHIGCLMDAIDMSSPMISNANISDLNIPDEFLISISSIPVK